MKRLVVRRRPYGPPLTASRFMHCSMLPKESGRNLKKLMMKLGSQVSTLQIFDKFYKNNNPFCKKLTLTKKNNLKTFRKTNDGFRFHNPDYLRSNFIKKGSFP